MNMPTVAAIIAAYLRHSRSVGLHCPQALSEREYALGLFEKQYGQMTADELRPYHLTDWIEERPTWRSVSTKRAKANMIRACFQWALEQERISRNPFVSVKYAEAERRPELPDSDLERLATLANKPFEHAVRFLRLTGARLKELCLAQWEDVDLERGVWTIHRHKSRRYTQRPKYVALVPEACDLLRSLMAAARACAVSLPTLGVPPHEAVVGRPSGIIFLNSAGTPWTRFSLGCYLRRMKRRHGIRTKASLHGLRHRLATAALSNGAPLKLVAEQLGHATTAITERYYWHRSEEQIDAIRRAAALGVPKAG